jgi:hypothetical protein
MKDIFKNLLSSKRFWGFAMAGVVLIAKHFGHDIAPEAADALSDQAVLIASAAWNFVVMLWDKK